VSLLLFLLGVAGKLSVITFPAVFFAYDLLVEKRTVLRSLVDKLPFVISAGCIALVVASAQAAPSHQPDSYTLYSVLQENVWLLTGFGSYVIYHVPPDPSAGAELQTGAALILLAVFAAPLLLRRRFPVAVVLAYWVLFAFIPMLMLPFAHPVADRYLFFPSAPAIILAAWGTIAASERLGRRWIAGAAVLLSVVAFLWGRTTLAYLAEWRDPRSVWYAAAQRSPDLDIYFNLGMHYRQAADRLGVAPRGTSLPQPQARQLASAVWAGDKRLPALLSEWSRGQRGGPVERSFQDDLRGLAWDAFESCLRVKGTRIMPGLYYNRGLILLDRGGLQGARREFLAAVDEASRFPIGEIQGETLVESHDAVGVVAWRSGDYPEALRWFRLAEEEQTRFGGNWVPDLSAKCQQLEGIIASRRGR
jgi:hypothetical protein